MHNRELIARIIVISVLLYAMTGFGVSLGRLSSAEQTLRAEKIYLESLRRENDELSEILHSCPQSEQMEKLAREKLGMIMPGEKIFVFTRDREELTWCRK